MGQFRVLLKPLGDKILRREIKLAKLYAQYPQHPYRRDNLPELEARVAAETSQMQPRVIDADMVKVVDGGTMLIGIGPGNFTATSKSVSLSRNHNKALKLRKANPEFYEIGHTPPGTNPHDPSHTDYVITRKFEKILSVNVDNVISVNGKPIVGFRGLDKGIKHLDFDESRDWSVDQISDLLDE